MNTLEGILALALLVTLAFGLPFVMTHLWSRFYLRNSDGIRAYRKILFAICLVFAVLGLPYALLVGNGNSFGDNLVFGFVIFTLFILMALGHATGATAAMHKLKEKELDPTIPVSEQEADHRSVRIFK